MYISDFKSDLEPVVFIANRPYMQVDGKLVPTVYGGAEDVVDPTQDLAKVQDFIKGQVETYFNEMQRKVTVPTKTQEAEANERLSQLINPFIEPGLAEAKLTSSDAKDYVQFYMNDPDAKNYHDDVEKTFTALVKAGRPIARADILKHKLGDEYKADPVKFVEKQIAKHKQQLERAETAVDFGAAALNKAKSDTTFSNFEKLANSDDLSESLKEMEKALEGVTF